MCSFHIDIVGVHPGFYFLLEVSKIAGCIGSGCGPRLGSVTTLQTLTIDFVAFIVAKSAVKT